MAVVSADDQWERESFLDEQVVLDPYTTLEGVFVTSGCFLTLGSICFVVGAVAEQNWHYLLGTLALAFTAALAFLTYQKLRDTIELDFSNRELRCLRHFGGRLWRVKTTPFDAIHAVTVNPRHAKSDRNHVSRWTYGLIAILEDGTSLILTRETEKSFTVANEVAKRLAGRLECEHVEGKMEHRLGVKRGSPPKITWSEPLR